MSTSEDIQKLREEVVRLNVENILLRQKYSCAQAHNALLLKAACLYRDAHSAIKKVLPASSSFTLMQATGIKDVAVKQLLQGLMQAQMLLFTTIDLVQNEQGKSLIDGQKMQQPPL